MYTRSFYGRGARCLANFTVCLHPLALNALVGSTVSSYIRNTPFLFLLGGGWAKHIASEATCGSPLPPPEA